MYHKMMLCITLRLMMDILYGLTGQSAESLTRQQ
jgi:hypothetical protein